MGKTLYLAGIFILLVVAYLLLWPTGLTPRAWVAPADRGLTGDFVPNELIRSADQYDLLGRHGPEDVAIGRDGLVYTGTADGAILRVDPATGNATVFAETGGRPLGMEFDENGNLVIADAIAGLVSIYPEGRLEVLAHTADDGSIIGYADDLDITPDGRIWFSDASTKFFPGEWGGTRGASVAEIWEHEGTGRVLSFDRRTGEVTTHLTGLVFPNGIAADPAGRFILINETGKYRVLQHWLSGPQAGETTVLIDNLPGFPDNINRDAAGGYFLGLVSPRSADVDKLAEKPLVRNILWRIPGFRSAAVPDPYSHLIRFDENGSILASWQDPAGSYPDITGAVRIENGDIWISSLEAPTLARLKP